MTVRWWKMHCKHCGTDNKDNSVFCANCHKYIGTGGKYMKLTKACLVTSLLSIIIALISVITSYLSRNALWVGEFAFAVAVVFQIFAISYSYKNIDKLAYRKMFKSLLISSSIFIIYIVYSLIRRG